MKTKLLTLSAIFMLSMTALLAQEKTTVTATSADISDNLDLRALASVFGEALDLEDFEHRINDPKTQLSNLDLNNDHHVDYLRVIESVEGNVHLVIVQAVLDKDIYQDVATLEVERDPNNKIQIQVVGDVFLYGANYIYEPVYVHSPKIYSVFWKVNYRPYYSAWYWNVYPTYYYFWNPFPSYRYRRHVSTHINFGNHYHYATNRRCQVAYASYAARRGNGYEKAHPDRSFINRNTGHTNRQALDHHPTIKTPRSNSPRGNVHEPRSNNSTKDNSRNQPGTRTPTTPKNSTTREKIVAPSRTSKSNLNTKSVSARNTGRR